MGFRNEYTMFPKSKPYGYHPPSVEKQIKQYEAALSQVNAKLIESRNIIMQQKEKISRLQDELREMHIQMSNLELPDVEDVVSHCVLDDFKNYNNPEAKMFPDPPIINNNENLKLKPIKNQYNNNDIIINQNDNGIDQNMNNYNNNHNNNYNNGNMDYQNNQSNNDNNDDPFIILQ